MLAKLFLLFTVVPLLELFLLLQLGQRIGVEATVLLVLTTGVLGAVFAKLEGLRVLTTWRTALAQGRLPPDGVLSGVLVLLGGAFLVAPGVLTDVTGLLLLIPPSRRWIARLIKHRLERRLVTHATRSSHERRPHAPPASEDVVDAPAWSTHKSEDQHPT